MFSKTKNINISQMTFSIPSMMLMSLEHYFSAILSSSKKRARFSNCKNQKLSFVDCALLVLSRDYEVITFDQALQKAMKGEEPTALSFEIQGSEY